MNPIDRIGIRDAVGIIIDGKEIVDEKNIHNHFKDFKEDLLVIHNELDSDTMSMVTSSQGHLQNSIQNVESRLVVTVLNNIFKVNNKFDDQNEIISNKEKQALIKELTAILSTYYLAVFPIYAGQLLRNRGKEFDQTTDFKLNQKVKNYIRVTATNASDSHINTITDDILKTVKKTYQESLEEEIEKLQGEKTGSDQDIYKLARERALAGASQQRIIADIKKKYGDIAKDRAKTIARTETNRAFTQSQFQADVQFLENTGLLNRAYKVWRTRSDKPCPFCLKLEARGPIPFDEDFVEFGTTLEADYTKKNGEISIRKLAIDYEPLTAGNAHVNCGCIYKLVIKNDSGEFVENMLYGIIDNGGKGSGNHGHSGRPGKQGGSSKSGGYQDFSGNNSYAVAKEMGFPDGNFDDNPNYSEEEKTAVRYYGRIGNEPINEILRTGSTSDPEERTARQKLKTLVDMKKQTLAKDVTLYRGAQINETLNIGDSISDRAFVSTSFDKDIARDFATEQYESGNKYLFKINTPKGSKGIFVGQGNDWDEVEWVMDKQRSFTVQSVSEPDDDEVITLGVSYE